MKDFETAFRKYFEDFFKIVSTKKEKMKKLINEEKIVKEIELIKVQLEKDNYFLTTKGLVSIVVNLVEEQLK